MPDPPENMRMVREIIRGVADSTGARLLLLPDDLEFHPSDFGDTSHLTARGAAKYTHWLGQALLDYDDAMRASPSDS
jgi:hypothetical protein